MTSLLTALILACTPGPDGKMSCNCGKAEAGATTAAAPAKAHADEEGGECHHAPTTASAPPSTDAKVLARGEKLKGLKAVTLEQLLAKPAEFDGKTVAVEAKVRRACERKGCWMELSSSDSAPGVRVTFKDYGFFVPLDAAGSTAKVEGLVKVASLSPERAKHYESEGAKVPKAADGTYREVQLVAAGLELRR
ncbi:MAG: DUF4920 domain-containing protein [Archangium sp.]|nr:DUF4920 domain-containing protein [Archangium sp.]